MIEEHTKRLKGALVIIGYMPKSAIIDDKNNIHAHPTKLTLELEKDCITKKISPIVLISHVVDNTFTFKTDIETNVIDMTEIMNESLKVV